MNRWAMSLCLVASMFSMVACVPGANRTANQAANTANATGAAVRNALNTNPNRAGVDNARRLHAEKKVADRVVQTGLVTQASVMVLGDTAYIGVVQKPGAGADMSVANKTRVTNVVKRYDPSIKTVYISANPDVYSHFQTFAADLAAGRPVSGFWNNFRSIVTRVWPTAR